MHPFNQDTYIREKFSHIVLENEQIENIGFENCIFTSCRFLSCTFKSCKFVNCQFVKSDISASKMRSSVFLDVTFDASRAMSINWAEAAATTVLQLMIRFSHTIVSYSSFSGLALKKLQMTDCTAHEVDFIDCDLEGANFSGTDLKGSIFSNCDLKRTDFRKAQNYMINPIENRIKNAKFSMPEAIVLLKPFRIEIENEFGDKVLEE